MHSFLVSQIFIVKPPKTFSFFIDNENGLFL
jgi:hypothetical protein